MTDAKPPCVHPRRRLVWRSERGERYHATQCEDCRVILVPWVPLDGPEWGPTRRLLAMMWAAAASLGQEWLALQRMADDGCPHGD